LPKELKEEAKKFIQKLSDKSDRNKKSNHKPLIKKREFGSLKGKINLSDDFDSPLEEFNDYM
jgi:hypothetical protein